jgi:hemoglobin
MQLLIALIIIGIILIIYIIYKNKTSQRRGKSLYDRLGGIFSISAVVNHFSDSLINNPIVGVDSQNPFLRDWSRNHLDRLPGLKFMRTLWLASISGGPYKFVATKPGKCPFSLENAHKSFQISPSEFDAVASELAKSLDHFNVPQKEKSEVLAAFSAHKGDIITGYDAAHNLPAPKITC